MELRWVNAALTTNEYQLTRTSEVHHSSFFHIMLTKPLFCIVMVLATRQLNGFSTAVTIKLRRAAAKLDPPEKSSRSHVPHKQNLGRSSNSRLSIPALRVATREQEEGNIGILSFGYGSLSVAYVTQVIMALNKSGPTLTFYSAIGGPALAGALSLILSREKRSNSNDNVSSKLMNGTLMIYSCLCLILVGLAPQLDKPFGKLYFISALFTFLVNAKGYSRGYPMSGFVEETKRILPRIHEANVYARPRDLPNFVYLVGMVTVILLKADIILPFLADPSSYPLRVMAFKVSSLAKLSVLGGSLVTLRDAANQKLLGQGRFKCLNLFVSYIFGSLAGAFCVNTA